ncbi:transglutaminase [Parasulfuritortus cantonensis]|uniref:Transglutaminase n=1 Tax=Parasulfuritortus cantonensis TaxID=2528202 RepID=A0A4R1BAF3_9PROT|nr:transglutaminase-like cysteine peptidase [Parasulfuritortus cantonensis]TCJ13914.1 transglutaminase [Parasulfuritortus cantonensis]
MGRNRIHHATLRVFSLSALFACAFGALALLATAFDFDAFVQLAARRYGARTEQVAGQWRNLLTASRTLPEVERVRKVNDFFNRQITYKEDSEVWGQSDYWATPLETMGRGAGDCEDFAIAKYFSLLLAGLPADRLRLTYVKAKIGGRYSNISIAHMVLGYYPETNDEPLILDNLLADIRPASQRPDLTPVFSFNTEGLWVGNAPGGTSAGSSTSRLSRWRDLLSRMKAEGFE